MRSAAVIILAVSVLAAHAGVTDSLRRVVDEHPTDPVAGLWQIAGDGAVIAVTPAAGMHQSYNLHVVDSPDLSIAPGVACGSLRATAVAGRYDGRLAINPGNSRKQQRMIDCTANIESPGRMTLNTYRRKKRISLWRWIPYFFRVTVIEENNRPQNLDGAIRIYPQTPGTSHTVL